ncbi:pleiotropic drug resistance protein PDR [Hyphopichia burtonii NRRL Y-1933]|uniref:Pleiotropic drug resistance protein PDR n=1 Tax=Hyphopichia burtonii NRRL Y-1933 TaxID=984485 RepID=A0A1E4RF70_9ASCO|nr:pleiotropic drug resistance protein PDR [Hyphopichia burtonii NRRL Y-1933]ODV65866.1 pleiotropic drug resistance protein PDR [Hyphopichia burtonii NRRL Y-1933]
MIVKQPRLDSDKEILSSNEGDGDREYQGYTEEVSGEIKELARTFTHSSTNNLTRYSSNVTVAGSNPMNDINDPRLDPESSDFDSKYWIRNFNKYIANNAEYYKPTSLGVYYKGLRAYGDATDSTFQSDFGNIVYKYGSQLVNLLSKQDESKQYDILKPMDGLIRPGELTVVLGRPGAGCSTFLKTLANQTHGFKLDPNSKVSYDGLTPHQIVNHYRGEVVYCAETESHFAHLSVGDTLEFAAKLRTPSNRPEGVDRETYARFMANVVMATYGLSHTRNTKVGNDFIRGVSGGERKRVSIAEVALSKALIQCWDNSTRGLDSATALEFIRALKTSANIEKTTPLIAIYQCSQDAYDLFDKAMVLYDGYQIFFGSATAAKDYFLKMGYVCPDRQTTADFLTSLTNPAERVVKPGFENKVPRTPKEFYDYWQGSPDRAQLLKDIDDYENHVKSQNKASALKEFHNSRQSKRARPASSFTVSYGLQIKYIMGRNIKRIKGDPSITIFSVIGNTIMGLIIASIFYNLKFDTGSFYYRTAAMYFAVLFNSFSCLLEIFTLYEARSIVEKHKTYALYHPSADALASIITELPAKIATCIAFNLVLYFMVNFKRTPSAFFIYLLINFTSTLSMSHMFRTLGASTKSLQTALLPASILLMALSMYTGFVIPTVKMHGWSKWIHYLNPMSYAFEALIANEFHNREFPCSDFVPSGQNYPTTGDYSVCSVIGAEAGNFRVNGDRYINTAFKYYNHHKWRNWGIVLVFAAFFLFLYLIICEYNKGAMQKGEILLFQRKALKKINKLNKLNGSDHAQDIETGEMEKSPAIENDDDEDSDALMENNLPESGNIFHWRKLTYQVKIKKEDRIILNEVDGWVKPGQVTALMGASGAGKTTLLNALSERLTSGVITSGTRMVNGRPLDSSFQRSIGYVQQQDLHLETSTVREALTFSAYLRQPQSVPKAEKDAYVDYIIHLLEMEKYSDAIVGVAGEGLNVEQRKRLTIGVELVAKPKLLVFLDEPTSGLDSQTAWSICKLIRKLADHGQAILCTIHQPSAILMKEFDRLLFLQKGGQTVYFGDLGKDCTTLINYFEKYGAEKCPPQANPAEWMLQVIGAAPGSHASQDYHEVWRNSSEHKEINYELDQMEAELPKRPHETGEEDARSFAASYWTQYYYVTKRVFEQYWRSPSYTWSKVTMSVFTGLFNGFTFFKADRSLQGLQNQMFSVFMFFVIFTTLIQQYLPYFVSQRDLYEVRERPSKTFSWVAFILSQITAEIPWNVFCGTLAFFCWYYPLGLYVNSFPTNTVNERGALMWIVIVLFFIYSSTMGQLCISFNEIADNAANLALLLFTMCLTFCGVLASSNAMPRFWIFMYRCNPFTYLVSVILSTGLAHSYVECSKNEYLHFNPLGGQTCGEYMKAYMLVAGGYLTDESATKDCSFCTTKYTDVFLKSVAANYDTRGRDIGIFIAFIFINIFLTIFFYWWARVPKGTREKK